MVNRAQSFILFLLVLIAILSSAIISCSGSSGGSGGEPDFASISVEGGQMVRYTLTENANAPDGFSPDLWSISTSSSNAHIYCREWNGSQYVMRVQIDIYDYAVGIHTGDYFITDPGNQVQFSPHEGSSFSTNGMGTSGTINITELGGDGGKITGTFDVITEVNSMPSLTARLTGNFQVTRWSARTQ